MRTVAGPFAPGWGLCRTCWRRVPATMRREFRHSRDAFAAAPGLETSVVFYWLWELALATAELKAESRRAA